jgi:hypothetical protein
VALARDDERARVELRGCEGSQHLCVFRGGVMAGTVTNALRKQDSEWAERSEGGWRDGAAELPADRASGQHEERSYRSQVAATTQVLTLWRVSGTHVRFKLAATGACRRELSGDAFSRGMGEGSLEDDAGVLYPTFEFLYPSGDNCKLVIQVESVQWSRAAVRESGCSSPRQCPLDGRIMLGQ